MKSSGADLSLIRPVGIYTHENINYVHIYHIGSFKNSRRNGSQILQEFCFQADKCQLILSLSLIFMPTGKNEPMGSEHLRPWSRRFGFRGSSHFKREPCKIKDSFSLFDELLNFVPVLLKKVTHI